MSLELDFAPAFLAAKVWSASSKLFRMSHISCFEDDAGAKSVICGAPFCSMSVSETCEIVDGVGEEAIEAESPS